MGKITDTGVYGLPWEHGQIMEISRMEGNLVQPEFSLSDLVRLMLARAERWRLDGYLDNLLGVMFSQGLWDVELFALPNLCHQGLGGPSGGVKGVEYPAGCPLGQAVERVKEG